MTKQSERKAIRFGIASFAHMHAFSYLNCLKWLPGADITAVAEENAALIPSVKQLVTKFYRSYEELVKDPNVDCILITTENAFHKKVAVMALENGKDVIVEKPMATTLNDADAMIAAAKKTGKKLIQCYPCRYHPTVKSIKNLIDEGKIGKLLAISATNHGQMPAPEGTTKWFSQKEFSGGGALMDHITHVADLNFWFSKENIKSVYAVKKNLFHPKVDIDDCGMVTMNYDKGLKASLDPSWNRPKSFETWGDVTMTLYGTEQTVYLDMFAQSAHIFSNAETHSSLINYGSEMDYLMLKDFVEHMQKDEMPMLSGLDGRKALEVSIMAYQSSESGKIITK
jgi:predicted dehydrogenase